MRPPRSRDCTYIARVAALVLLSACGPNPAMQPPRPTTSPSAAAKPATRVAVPDRVVAVTFDDLVVGGRDPGLPRLERMTDDLLRILADERVPVVAFVNEAKLGDDGERAARLAQLRKWSDAGHELGNHTYAHPSLQDTPLAEFEADVVRGEPVIRALQAERGEPVRYFRHPYLRTGPDMAVRAAFEQFLHDRGYTVAPVTLDNSDWMFNFVYAEARTAGDAALMQRVGEAFVAHIDETCDFYEASSDALFGRPIAHVLLLHANELNADWFDDVVRVLRRRGYRFVRLAEALEDPAYRERDDYAGPAGVTWLYRWDHTRGRRQIDWSREPEPPAFVRDAYAAAQKPAG